MYTLCSQVYTFVFFCGGVAARRVAENCSATPDTTQRDAQGGGRGGWRLKKKRLSHTHRHSRGTQCTRHCVVRAVFHCVSACGCCGCGAGVLHVYTLCSQVCTRKSSFCGGVAARRVAEYCSAIPFPKGTTCRRPNAWTNPPERRTRGIPSRLLSLGALGKFRSHSGRGVRCPHTSRPEVL